MAGEPARIVTRPGEPASVKVWSKRVRFTVADCDPLVPMMEKLNGLGVETERLLTVAVLVCPAKIEVGLNVQVIPVGQDKVMLPVKLLGAEAETVKFAVVEPIRTETVGCGEVIEKTAAPVPDNATDCGLPVALSLMLKLPALPPVEVGANVTLTEQLWPTFRTLFRAPHVFV